MSGGENADLIGLQPAAEAEEEAEQLALLDELDGGLASAFPRAARAGPGRPKGSINRKTMTLTAYYRARGFRDPIAAQAEFVSADPVALRDWFREHRAAGDDGPTLFEVVQLQMKVADQLAPYLHGKQPIKVEVDDGRLPVLIIDLGGGAMLSAPVGRYLPGGEGALSIGAPIEENQEVTGDDGTKSHGGEVSRQGEDADPTG